MTTDATEAEYDGGPITAPSMFSAKSATGGSSGSCPCGDGVVAEQA